MAVTNGDSLWKFIDKIEKNDPESEFQTSGVFSVDRLTRFLAKKSSKSDEELMVLAYWKLVDAKLVASKFSWMLVWQV